MDKEEVLRQICRKCRLEEMGELWEDLDEFCPIDDLKAPHLICKYYLEKMIFLD